MTDLRQSSWWWWGPVIALMVTIFALSSTARIPDLPGGTDKQVHGFTYGVLALLAARALTKGNLYALSAGVAARAWLVATVYGLSDEVHQRFVPGRSADVLDLAADAAVAFVVLSALWACGIIARSMQSRARHRR